MKLEVIGDQATLYPDVQATLEATRVLVKEGFTVLPYTSDDIVFAKRLIDAGAAAIMPLGAPIGSGMGIQNQAHIRILREMITGVPLIVDAGVGTASDAAIAMELGADAVLMNTGIANAQDPVLMAEAMKHGVHRRPPGLSRRAACRKSFTQPRVRRWKAWFASDSMARALSRLLAKGIDTNKRAAAALFDSANPSEHLRAVNVNRVAYSSCPLPQRDGPRGPSGHPDCRPSRLFDRSSVTTTIFSPAARHFLVHASCLALAPLAPHLSSADPAVNSCALAHIVERHAVRANTKQIARQSTQNFSHGRFSPFEFRCGPTPQLVEGSSAILAEN